MMLLGFDKFMGETVRICKCGIFLNVESYSIESSRIYQYGAIPIMRTIYSDISS